MTSFDDYYTPPDPTTDEVVLPIERLHFHEGEVYVLVEGHPDVEIILSDVPKDGERLQLGPSQFYAPTTVEEVCGCELDFGAMTVTLTMEAGHEPKERGGSVEVSW